MTHTPSLPGDVHEERLIVPGDSRKPAGRLTYAAGVDCPHPFEPLGPNALGERLWPVTIERTESSTVVGLAYQFPGEKVREGWAAL
jgi:hypothetical protein